MSTTPNAAATDLARSAAQSLAATLPSSVPLTVAEAPAGLRPAPDSTAVAASYVGETSADLVLVAHAAVAELLDGAGDAPVQLADVLRPSLEAAARVFGPGVLDAAGAQPVGGMLDDEGVQVFVLESEDGPQAWLGVRVRTAVAAAAPEVVEAVAGAQVPQQRLAPTGERANMRLLYDVEMSLTAEIGRARLPVRQVLELTPGSVLELDRAAGAPADLMVNGRLLARGEVVVVDEDYGIRITEIVSGVETTA